jgi:hypothetical protein
MPEAIDFRRLVYRPDAEAGPRQVRQAFHLWILDGRTCTSEDQTRRAIVQAGPGWSGYLLIVQVFSNHPGGPTQAEAARFLHHLLERVWPLLPRR